ncbi:MAG TPA: HD domain-containing protein [Candidatus Saccharimonadales bacterium]|nr:HD domain-containing protein [Candidatus Saccharimonadales bacterium]
MSENFKKSIQKAKNYYKNFVDPVHDLSHTERVAKNAILIAQHAGAKNLELIKLAAYWHDVGRTQGLEIHEEPGALMAKEDLISRGFDEETANLVYEAIRFHKLSDNPLTIEGKIIRDADKLDFISLERWGKGLKAEQYDHLLAMLSRLEAFPRALKLSYSKELYRERLPKFMKYYSSIKNQLPSTKNH